MFRLVSAEGGEQIEPIKLSVEGTSTKVSKGNAIVGRIGPAFEINLVERIVKSLDIDPDPDPTDKAKIDELTTGLASLLVEAGETGTGGQQEPVFDRLGDQRG